MVGMAMDMAPPRCRRPPVCRSLVIRGTSQPAAPTQGAAPLLGRCPSSRKLRRRVTSACDLTGLGTVTPLNTVTVRSRVDGQLMDVDLPRGPGRAQGRRARSTSIRVRFRCSSRRPRVRRRKTKPRSGTRRSIFNATRSSSRRTPSRSSSSTRRSRLSISSRGAQERSRPDRRAPAESDVLPHHARRSPGRVGLRLVDPGNIVHAAIRTA